MKLCNSRNQEKFNKFIRKFIPMRTETFLKFMGITDVKEIPEEEEWIWVSSAGIFGDKLLVSRKYELESIIYINTKGERTVVDMCGKYGIEIDVSLIDELLDNVVLLDE